jgi:predicted membrane protein
MRQELRTVPRMALVGAMVALVVGVFRVQDNLASGGEFGARMIGELVAYAVMGAIFGSLVGWFLRSRSPR